MEEQKKYVYAKGYKGLTARVPADKLKEWSKHQAALNSGKERPDSKEADSFLEYIRNL